MVEQREPQRRPRAAMPSEEAQQLDLPRDRQAAVARILDAHRLYLESERRDGQRADLREFDLSDMAFVGIDLRRARLARAMLDGSDWSRANLQRANLSGASMRRVCLRGADLMMARLSGAQLNRAVLAGARLDKAEMEFALLI